MIAFGGAWLIPQIKRADGDGSPKLFVVSGVNRRPEYRGVDARLAEPVNQDALPARIRAVYASRAC
ncbi:MAG: hypothetical protein R3C49_04100 [Planctomycetaceae bacterium]